MFVSVIQKYFRSFILPNSVVRTMSTTITDDMHLNYKDVKELLEKKQILLIDVREPKELEETGTYPGSINIPLGQLSHALKNFSEDEFKSKYNVPKPDPNTPIVFSCRSGNRSIRALQIALELGFKRSRHYKGGFLDWMNQKKNKS